MDMNKPVFQIFSNAKNRAEKGLCTVCEKEITQDEFRDETSRQEYDISGMCQSCQDSVFG